MIDIHKYTSMTDHLDILENTLRLGHLAPTAPDTLGTAPATPSNVIIPSLTMQRMQAFSDKKALFTRRHSRVKTTKYLIRCAFRLDGGGVFRV